MRYIVLFALLVTAGATLCPGSGCCAPPILALGTAVVDGHYGEWHLANDFFAYMYRGGDSTKVAESRLYLRYDCATGVAYALVLCEPGVIGYVDPAEDGDAWIAIDTHTKKVVNMDSGNDGVPPDFAWIGLGFDGNPQHALGYEASFYATRLTNVIFVHIDVWDEELQTSALVGHPGLGAEVVIQCVPNATQGASFGAIKALYR